MIYGCTSPNAKTRMMPVAASQYFQHAGHSIVYVDGSGHLVGALTDTSTSKVFGAAIIPKGRGNTTNTSDDHWMSSATAAVDYVPVITADNPGYEFLWVSDGTPVVTSSGNDMDIINTNDATTEDATVDIGSTTNDDLIQQDIGINVSARATTADVVVAFNKAEIQADT
jgi:hypothetical protein